MNKPQVGIASVWYEGNPCNMHLVDLADEVKKGVRRRPAWSACGSTPIGVSDGISMGTDGMSYSLQSRDLIADSIETVMGAQWYDALRRPPRLRQEHARLRDGDGPAQPPVDHGLRRHDPRRLARSAAPRTSSTSSRRSRPTASTWPGKITEDERKRNRRASLPRRRRLRRHVHRQHDGHRHRSAWACRCRTSSSHPGR